MVTQTLVNTRHREGEPQVTVPTPQDFERFSPEQIGIILSNLIDLVEQGYEKLTRGHRILILSAVLLLGSGVALRSGDTTSPSPTVIDNKDTILTSTDAKINEPPQTPLKTLEPAKWGNLGQTYIIHPGEWLWDIIRKRGVTDPQLQLEFVTEVAFLNEISDPDVVSSYQLITIPERWQPYFRLQLLK